MKPTTSAIPSQNTAFEKVQSTSVLDQPSVCEVLSNPDYQAVQDFECQIKILGAEIDAFAEARKSITQTLRTDVRVSFFFSFQKKKRFLHVS